MSIFFWRKKKQNYFELSNGTGYEKRGGENVHRVVDVVYTASDRPRLLVDDDMHPVDMIKQALFGMELCPETERMMRDICDEMVCYACGQPAVDRKWAKMNKLLDIAREEGETARTIIYLEQALSIIEGQ